MISVSSIGPKVVSSVRKGGNKVKKMALPQDINLTQLTNTKNAKVVNSKNNFSSCGSVEIFCTPLISF